MEKERLSKIMASRGMCSRREADRYIERGLVLVDGQVISELGTKVLPNAEIELAEAGQKRQAAQATFLLNKPIGYVSAQPEDGHKPAEVLLRKENRWREDRSPRRFNPRQLRGLAPAGRLDIDSNGLLVLTQDGRVARRIIGEDSDVDKEYLVRVTGRLSDNDLKLLNHGLDLDGKALKPAKITWQNKDQLRFILREGKKRQIRRMCELVGLKVVGLKRIRIGKIVLGNLPNGQWRYLRDDESF
jgi:23S rRNA pseudouridine2604 synthase